MKKKRKKMFSAVGIVFLLLSVATIVPATARQSVNEKELTKETIERITKVMSGYTKQNTDGTVKIIINDASRVPITEKEFRFYKKGIDNLNMLVLSGEMKIQKTRSGELIGKPTQKFWESMKFPTYSEWISLVKTLNIPNEQKKQLLNITEREWNTETKKLEQDIRASGGKNGFAIHYHWYGIEYKLWLNHYWTQKLVEHGVPFTIGLIITIIAAAIGLGPLGAAAVFIVTYIYVYIGQEAIRNADHGNGVKFTFYDYWWTGSGIDYGKVEPQ